jgi:hypothetical protein
LITRATETCGDAGIQPVSLRILRSTIHHNEALRGAGINHVTGLAPTIGPLEIVDSTVSFNMNTNRSSGAGIWTQGNLRLDRSTVNNNAGGEGAGIAFFDELGGGHLSIERSTIRDNSSTATGGAIAVPQGGTVDIVQSTVTGNDAATSGGGMQVASATVTVDHSTFSNNTAGVTGGQIEALHTDLTLRRSTIVAPESDTIGAPSPAARSAPSPSVAERVGRSRTRSSAAPAQMTSRSRPPARSSRRATRADSIRAPSLSPTS